MSTDYAELHCLSNFSFQRGASSALELFERAVRHGYTALAITDECTLAGIVRALQASQKTALPLIVGSEMHIENGPKIVLLVEDKTGYEALCKLITAARRRAKKGEYRLLREDFQLSSGGLLAIWLPDIEGDAQACLAQGNWLREHFAERLWLGVELHRGADDDQRLADLLALAQSLGIP
ncbi:PHP domain-containing protein, partial [Pseudomonas syringae]